MSTKSECRAAREVVAAYHEAQLAELLQRVGETVDSFRAGELDAFDADQVLFQFSRTAKELWKFCNLGDVVFAARLISEEAPAAWWERGPQTGAETASEPAHGPPRQRGSTHVDQDRRRRRRPGMNTTELIARGDFAHASLRMATAACLARFKGRSRIHTESDLRAFLA